MRDIMVLNIEIPNKIYDECKEICDCYGIDFRDSVVDLLTSFVRTFHQIHSDPAAKVLLEAK